MREIKVIRSYATGLDSFFDKPITSLFLEDNFLGKGGFGEVYCVKKIDRRESSSPLVAKLILGQNEKNFNTVVALQRLVQEEVHDLQKRNIDFFDKYPSLLALPLFSFEGTLGGNRVCGYLSYNLNELDFLSSDYLFFDCLENDLPTWIRYQRRDLSVKYMMAYGFAVSCSFLRRINFIHADITPDNLFIHKFDPICVLIDYDSGAVIDAETNLPTTEGKHCADWTPPEKNGESAEKHLTAKADDWAINIAIHYILTGYPAFFTKNMSPNTIKMLDEMYSNGSTIWPDISSDPKFIALFAKGNLEEHKKYRKFFYDPLDERVKLGFENTFGRGAYDKLIRHKAEWWIPVLEKCVKNSSFKTELTWDFIKKFQPDFPHIQSTSIRRQIPIKANNLKSSRLFGELSKDLFPKIVLGEQRLQTYRSIIERIANESGLDGKELVKNLEDLHQMYSEMMAGKRRGEGLSRSEKILLSKKARVVHVDISNIIG